MCMVSVYRAVEDIDLWLNEVEGHLASQDLGKVRRVLIRFNSLLHVLSGFG